MSSTRFILKYCCFLLWIVISARSTQAGNWIVYPDGTGDAPTIQAAVDLCGAGDTISVMAGVYEQQGIDCSKDSITIIGVDGAENTILQSNGYAPWILDLGEYFYTTSGFRIRGLTFEGGVYAVWAKYFSFVTIEACTFRGNGAFTVLFENSHHVEMQYNLFSGNGNAIRVFDSSNFTIERNTIAYNGGFGIEIGGNGSVSVLHNLVTDNGTGITSLGNTITFLCNDVYGNGTDYLLYDIPDPTGTNGNISIDPEYCSIDPPATHNFYLQSDSPCAPGNHPDGYACGGIGAYPVGCGTTAIQENSWGTMKTRFK